MIGDTTLDIKMAENAGMEGILVETGQAGLDGKYKVDPTYVAEDLMQAVDIILKSNQDKYSFF